MILGWDSMHQSLIWFFCTVFDEELALIGYFEFFGRDDLDDENYWLEWSDGCRVLRIMDMMYFWCILLFLYIYLSHSLLKKLTQFRHNSKIKARSPTSQQNQPNRHLCYHLSDPQSNSPNTTFPHKSTKIHPSTI